MTLQLIKNKPVTFRIKNTGYQFVRPKYLMPSDKFKLIEAKVKGSTMVWNIEGETISCNQIKKLIR
jgi:hypothetical protein